MIIELRETILPTSFPKSKFSQRNRLTIKFITQIHYLIQDTRYKKLYFPSVLVQQITLATRAIFRHNKGKITYNSSCKRRKSDVVIINKCMHKLFKSTRVSLHIR